MHPKALGSCLAALLLCNLRSSLALRLWASSPCIPCLLLGGCAHVGCAVLHGRLTSCCKASSLCPVAHPGGSVQMQNVVLPRPQTLSCNG